MRENIIREIWERRSLIFLLSVTDVKLRYRNSVLGFFWTFLEPLLMLAVLYFIFTTIIRSELENYPLYLLLGLIIWYMFSRATSSGMTSLTDRAHIIQKVYFRREIVVISSSLTSFIMMLFEFAAFAFFIIVLQFVPTVTILILPPLLVILFLLTLGISFYLSILNVYFKDIKFIWQVLLQAGFFLTPIIYSLDMFPENIQFVLRLNPLVPLLDIAHDVVLYNSLPNQSSLIYLLSSTAVIFISGYIIFNFKNKKIVEEL